MSLEDGIALIKHALTAMGSIAERVAALNTVRAALHQVSPMAAEPVDCVLWVHTDAITANDYNPNAVAPPEMELLHRSIAEDGFTQPVVAWEADPGAFTVVDGFHRNRVGRERADVRARVHGYLPVAVINRDREGLGDRMVSTIRHNRARGKHNVDSMSEIVVELKRRNWTDDKICRSLGMQADEVLRLCQISGLTEMFKDADFSRAWDVGDLDVSPEAMDLEALLKDPDAEEDDE